MNPESTSTASDSIDSSIESKGVSTSPPVDREDYTDPVQGQVRDSDARTERHDPGADAPGPTKADTTSDPALARAEGGKVTTSRVEETEADSGRPSQDRWPPPRHAEKGNSCGQGVPV